MHKISKNVFGIKIIYNDISSGVKISTIKAYFHSEIHSVFLNGNFLRTFLTIIIEFYFKSYTI